MNRTSTNQKALAAACALLGVMLVSGWESMRYGWLMPVAYDRAWRLAWLFAAVGSYLILKRWRPERRTVIILAVSFVILHAVIITAAYLLMRNSLHLA